MVNLSPFIITKEHFNPHASPEKQCDNNNNNGSEDLSSLYYGRPFSKHFTYLTHLLLTKPYEAGTIRSLPYRRGDHRTGMNKCSTLLVTQEPWF